MAQETPPGKLTVDQVVSQAVQDSRSYYHGCALRMLLTYEQGNIQAVSNTILFLNKLLELEQSNQTK